MKVDFYIPKDQTIPTRLRLKVDGIDVYYSRLHDQFGYDFEFYGVTEEKAMEITENLTAIMCSQSYDHGSQWRVTAIYPVEQDERYKASEIVRVIFRVRDSW